MVKRIIFLMGLAVCLGACAYSVYSNAYPYLKKVQLLAFNNKSPEFSLGDVVFNNLAKDISDDGRLRLVTQQPDCQIEGTILDYSEKIYSYDEANSVQDYLIVVTFSVTFTDVVNNKTLYEIKQLPVSEIYAVSSNSTSQFTTKQAAIDEICHKLFKTIMQNTLEAW